MVNLAYNSSIIYDWTDYLESIIEMSSNTVRVYISDIEGFFRYIKYRYKLYDENLNITLDDLSSITVNDIDLDLVKKINIQDIISYISYLDKYMDNSSATRSRKISSLRSFFEYLHVVIKVIDIDPMSTIRGPKLSKRLPIHLDIESVKKLLEAILETENIFYRKRYDG